MNGCCHERTLVWLHRGWWEWSAPSVRSGPWMIIWGLSCRRMGWRALSSQGIQKRWRSPEGSQQDVLQEWGVWNVKCGGWQWQGWKSRPGGGCVGLSRCYMSREFNPGQQGRLVNGEAQGYLTRRMVLGLCEQWWSFMAVEEAERGGGATYFGGECRKGFAKR